MNENSNVSYLLKVLKISSEILKTNDDISETEKQHLINIIQTVLDVLTREVIHDEHQQQDHVSFLKDIDLLHPMSFLNMKTLPFFICKGWLRF